MTTRLLRFFKASPRERAVITRSFLWVVIYRVGLSVVPFSVSKKWTVDHAGPVSVGYDDRVVAEIVRSVRFASKYVPYASCLTQALAARRLLEYYGQSADLKIGVSKSKGNFEAHAWLEIDGRIVLGKERMHSRYAVLGSHQTFVQ